MNGLQLIELPETAEFIVTTNIKSPIKITGVATTTIVLLWGILMRFKRLGILILALSLTVIAYGGSYSSGGGRSYSSSRSSSSSSSRSYSSSSSKSYSSGSKSSPSSSKSSGSSSKSSFSFFGKKADTAQAKVGSKSTFEKYKASQQSYDFLKKQPRETYGTRSTRQQTIFRDYYSRPAVAAQPQVAYQDSTWNPFFWMWLLDRPNQQAAWVYNHRSEISDERYKELVAKNKDLETQVKALEDQKAAKDPSYAPKEIDKDLMYSDDYVKDVQKDSGDFNWFLWLLVFPVSLGLLGWGVYAVFFKKRGF